ncbi:MAG: hypothetical protein ABJG88_10820 [Litorimonas sp.]
MALSKIFNLTAMGLFLGALCGCAAQGYQTTLFDGQVTYCVDKYAKEKVELAQQGHTGVFAYDTAEKPSLIHINKIIMPYGWKLTAPTHADPAWVPSGIKAWKRQCRLNLPDNAMAYRFARKKPFIFDNNGKVVTFPEGYKAWSHRAWFVGDKLVHVEVGQ